ncbi:hypothetical protein OG588_19015 [Streptomyces prunicolor]|uniref:hypothetical protein n=1 Tax=Streptomyces prunicolor TaxID=67348 RepID=UPI00386F2DD4|nr:hypothetical protein OG588_19015 [Streptomyces prunicolor]
MTAPATDSSAWSAECIVAQRPEYKELHDDCRQTTDIPLPGTTGILLQPRCGCACHPFNTPGI